jgi:hypothetical protein
MHIIKSEWKKDQTKESLELINRNFTRFFIGLKEIKNFSTTKTNKNEFVVYYALKKNATRKYYVSLLNSSFAFNENCLIALRDANWQNHEASQLNNETIKLINI